MYMPFEDSNLAHLFQPYLPHYTPEPRWADQAQAASHVLQTLDSDQDPEKKAQGHLQMAIMHHVGYDVAPDQKEMLSHLGKASKHSQVAKSIFRQVHTALEVPFKDGIREDEDEDDYWRASFALTKPDKWLDGVYWEDQDGEDRTEDIRVRRLDQSERSRALTLSRAIESESSGSKLMRGCRDGQLEAATEIARGRLDFSPSNSMPNALHWLVMFDPKAATEMLQAIARSMTAARLYSRLNFLDCPNDQCLGMNVFLPHRCLRLQGTPLHWAIQAGYTGVLRVLLDLGSDLDSPTQHTTSNFVDGSTSHYPSLTPLDLAVSCRHAQIAELLLARGCKVEGQDESWKHSPMHMVRRDRVPFERYIAHGPHY